MARLYLDHAATTPLHPEVAQAMAPYVSAGWVGNPSSVHRHGRQARIAIETARHAVARLIHAEATDIVFTSGGTEADNLAIVGTCLAHPGGHVLMSAIEHHAVLHCRPFLERLGYEVELIPVQPDGHVALSDIESRLRADTILVSMMAVNNELGTIQPWAAAAELCAARNIAFHTDAVQAIGSIPMDTRHVTLLTMSAHKINGPPGIGALFVRAGHPLRSTLHGGSQENTRRAGTENVAAIVGFGAAAERIAPRPDPMLAEAITAACPTARRVGSAPWIPSIQTWHFPGTDGEALLARLDIEGVAASMGSACSSGALSASHVLLALGMSQRDAFSCLRFSTGLDTPDLGPLTAALKAAMAQQ